MGPNDCKFGVPSANCRGNVLLQPNIFLQLVSIVWGCNIVKNIEAFYEGGYLFVLLLSDAAYYVVCCVVCCPIPLCSALVCRSFCC